MTINKWKYFNINELFAGLVSGLLMVIIAISVAALIFKGALAVYFPMGAGLALLSCALVNLTTCIFSQAPFAIVRIEVTTAAILGALASIASVQLSPAALLPTMLALCSVATVTTGLLMFFLGHFKLSHIIRYLPYPVIGGVIAGIGWLVLIGSFRILMPEGAMWGRALALKSGLALSIGLFFLYLSHLKKYPWALPVAFLVLSVGIHMGFKIAGLSTPQLIAQDWIFSPLRPELPFQHMQLSHLMAISWRFIFEHFSYIASLAVIVTIITLLGFNIIEHRAEGLSPSNLDRELKLQGMGNLLSALGAGLPANLSLTGTILNQDMGAKSRYSGAIASLTTLLILLYIPQMLSLQPKILIAGMLLYIAAKLFLEWLYYGWRKLPHIDYFILIFIVIIVAFAGLLAGVFAGIAVTSIEFIFFYSRINTIKYSATLASYRSKVIRCLEEQQLLKKYGASVQIFKLQGYVFFASAKRLIDSLHETINKQDTQAVIIDFELVNGIDLSATISFLELLKSMEQAQIQLFFTGCSPAIVDQFSQQDPGQLLSIGFFPDLDLGLETAEGLLLSLYKRQETGGQAPLDDILASISTSKEGQALFVGRYLKKITAPAHHVLIEQGQKGGPLYFLETGEISIWLQLQNKQTRLAKSGAGTIIGEISFYAKEPRSATVRTESPCVLYMLTEEKLQELEHDCPEMALNFHKEIIYFLSLRLLQMNAALESMLN